MKFLRTCRFAGLQRSGHFGTSNYYHWYDYDVMGNLASVYSGDASSKPTIPDVTYTYTPAGGKASEEFKGNLNQAFTYDLRGRLTAIGDVTNTGRPFGASYSWSGAENITSAEFSQSGTPHAHKRYRYSFDYDNLNRLTSAQYAWFSGGTFTGSSAWQLESVAYDAAGNITSLKRRNQGGTLWHHYSLQYPAGDLERSKQSLLKCIHRETRVQSEQTLEISREARGKWDQYFGSL
ncbi:MAG: hypothetical protein ACNA8K_17360 [Cyclonatronaceae bacterium]